MTDDEIRQAAKDAGIKSWHVKAIDKLKEELEAPVAEPVAETPAEVVTEDPTSVLLVKQYKDGTHYREWVKTKDVDDRLKAGWIKASV